MTEKQRLRVELIKDKRYKLSLKKELKVTPKESPRAIEIRKILGISTLRDILGSLLPIRVCTHCGIRAHTEDDLWQFCYNPQAKHKHSNRCTQCKSLIDRGFKVVGKYSILPTTKVCTICKRANVTTGSRSWFLPRSKVCKGCMGTHEEIFGLPVRLKLSKFTVIHQGNTYTSIRALSLALGLSYIKTRRMLLQNKIKDIVWVNSMI